MREYRLTRRVSRPLIVLAFIGQSLIQSMAAGQVDPWAPPPTYYNSATGTGANLKSQLRTIMQTGHIQRSYGDFRFSAAIHDRDPANASRILLAYNRASVPATWDTGATWNREHVWPQSLQPGDASNSTTGNLGDPHALRPIDPGVNSSRSNDPFGFSSTTGSNRSLGSSVYFPGDVDKGDIARQLFYSEVRYGSQLGLTLVEGSPGSNQMGYLSALVAWNYLDPPDEFERRRNHTIYSNVYNPSYYTNNRNALIDHPEFVWSLYVDQQNDSQLYFAPGPDDPVGGSIRGFSTVSIVGPTTVLQESVTLNKTGFDGTYFSVTTTGEAVSNLTGRYNAFPLSAGGIASRSIHVSLTVPANQAGLFVGEVIVDNLDVTQSGGLGHGANDDNDIVQLVAQMLNSSNASFSSMTDVNSIEIDLGEIAQGEGDAVIDAPIYNRESTPGFTARLDVTFGAGTGDTDVLQIAPVTTLNGIVAGGSALLRLTMDDSLPGEFTATYMLSTSDQSSISNAQPGAPLTLTLTGLVTAIDVRGDMNCDGTMDAQDIAPFVLAVLDADAYELAFPECDVSRADLDENQSIDGIDVVEFAELLLN